VSPLQPNHEHAVLIARQRDPSPISLRCLLAALRWRNRSFSARNISSQTRWDTKADVTLQKQDDGFAITAVHLTLRAKGPVVDQAKFQELAAKAKAGCPVSKLLKADVTLDAALVD